MRKLLVPLLCLVFLAAGLGGGFFVHRNRLPPYRLMKAVARPLGLTRIPPAGDPPRHELLPAERDPLRRIRALPYVNGTHDPQPQRRGVIRRVEAKTSPGVSLYSSSSRSAAYLVDQEGRTVHEWAHGGAAWQHVAPLADGSLLATVKDQRLMKLDRRSRLVWQVRRRFHHSLWVSDDGTIWALTRRDELVPEIHPEVDTVVDFLTVLSPGGEVLEEISLLDLVQRSPYSYLLPQLGHRSFDPINGALDPLHTNHVEVFDGKLAQRSTLYSRGNILLSFRALSTIAIVDGATREIVWAWGPNNLAYQHRPTLLDNGHLLIFDNGPPERERSRVLELDPLSGEIVWSYTADDFFSRTRGAAQRLANGNTLITESDTGYVFEVTPEGERVWVFANPHFTSDGKRAALWWMTRYPPEEIGFGAGAKRPS